MECGKLATHSVGNSKNILLAPDVLMKVWRVCLGRNASLKVKRFIPK